MVSQFPAADSAYQNWVPAATAALAGAALLAVLRYKRSAKPKLPPSPAPYNSG